MWKFTFFPIIYRLKMHELIIYMNIKTVDCKGCILVSSIDISRHVAFQSASWWLWNDWLIKFKMVNSCHTHSRHKSWSFFCKRLKLFCYLFIWLSTKSTFPVCQTGLFITLHCQFNIQWIFNRLRLFGKPLSC